jgi:hypothetical protein
MVDGEVVHMEESVMEANGDGEIYIYANDVKV